jgi:hypothetical protein
VLLTSDAARKRADDDKRAAAAAAARGVSETYTARACPSLLSARAETLRPGPFGLHGVAWALPVCEHACARCSGHGRERGRQPHRRP